MSEKIKLIVALGNPGKQYELTRHNIGWLVFDQLSFARDLVWKNKFNGLYASYTERGQKVHFLKPQTFMNLSGASVSAILHFFKISVDEMLVVHDELDLPFGMMAFKKGGGLAGHNGLKSIVERIGDQNFYRFRMGIGRPKRGSASSFVLSNFNEEEDPFLGDFLLEGSKAIEVLMKKGYEKAASSYSKKSILPEESE